MPFILFALLCMFHYLILSNIFHIVWVLSRFGLLSIRLLWTVSYLSFCESTPLLDCDWGAESLHIDIFSFRRYCQTVSKTLSWFLLPLAMFGSSSRLISHQYLPLWVLLTLVILVELSTFQFDRHGSIIKEYKATEKVQFVKTNWAFEFYSLGHHYLPEKCVKAISELLCQGPGGNPDIPFLK